MTKWSIALILTLVLNGLAVENKFDQGLLKNGDIIFQTSMSSQSKAIQLATHSPYSHCGLVYIRNNSVYVFEASTKVKRTPLKRFLKKGEGGMFVVKRFKNSDSLLNTQNLGKMEAEGKKFEGLPYDSYFGWGNDRIYCSELIYKIYDNALGIKIGKTQQIKDFDLSNPVVASKLAERYGGKTPMDEIVISPSSQFDDPGLIEVFNNYPLNPKTQHN